MRHYIREHHPEPGLDEAALSPQYTPRGLLGYRQDSYGGVPTMTTGVRVIWPDAGRGIDEVGLAEGVIRHQAPPMASLHVGFRFAKRIQVHDAAYKAHREAIESGEDALQRDVVASREAAKKALLQT